jgi:hypothetical protein
MANNTGKIGARLDGTLLHMTILEICSVSVVGAGLGKTTAVQTVFENKKYI